MSAPFCEFCSHAPCLCGAEEYDADEEDMPDEDCPYCDGTGVEPIGQQCTLCGGSGLSVIACAEVRE